MSVLQVGVAELEVNGKPKRFLVFDNEAFDYELGEEDLSRAIHFCGTTAESKKALNGEIQSHFMACLNDFLGWEVSLEELMAGIRSGEMERKAACTS